MTVPRLPVLRVSGTPYEIGCQHGSRFAAEIRAFLEDGLARVNLLRREPLGREEATVVVDRHRVWIEAQLPDLAEEIHGLAAGAGISYSEAILLQLRRELIHADAAGCDCTCVGDLDGNGRAVLAQNVDLAGDMAAQALVLQVMPADRSQPRLCMFTFKGLCGYLGVNSAGLAIGLAMVTAADWRPGVPPYLLIRHLLGQRSIDGVLTEIRRIRRASSRYLMVAQGRQVLGIEMTVDDERLLTGTPLVHTNHFLHPDLLARDALEDPALTGSRRRAATMARLLASGESPAVALADHHRHPFGICAHGEGIPTRVDTVAAVVLRPHARELQALAGHPCAGRWVRHTVPEARRGGGKRRVGQ
jgi:isopenicillin-N N-acyltransferase-like protein